MHFDSEPAHVSFPFIGNSFAAISGTSAMLPVLALVNARLVLGHVDLMARTCRSFFRLALQAPKLDLVDAARTHAQPLFSRSA